MLDARCLRVLFCEDGGRDAGPETAGLVGKLEVGWWHDFGGGVEGFEVDEGLRLLFRGRKGGQCERFMLIMVSGGMERE